VTRPGKVANYSFKRTAAKGFGTTTQYAAAAAQVKRWAPK